jgi:hypothetical protein
MNYVILLMLLLVMVFFSRQHKLTKFHVAIDASAFCRDYIRIPYLHLDVVPGTLWHIDLL